MSTTKSGKINEEMTEAIMNHLLEMPHHDLAEMYFEQMTHKDKLELDELLLEEEEQ